MTLSADERRALGFVALLLFLSAGARLAAGGPPALTGTAPAADLDSLTAASREDKERGAARSRPLAEGERLDANRASAAELDRLPGIGPAVAQRIVAARGEGWVFARAEDLGAIKGIGPATVERIAPHLDFSQVPPGAGPPSRGRRASPSGPGGPGPQRAAAGAAGARSGASSPRGPVNVNRATQAELQALSGIGPALAERIVAHRTRQGPFRTLEDLTKVRGIGPKMAERLEGRVAF